MRLSSVNKSNKKIDMDNKINYEEVNLIYKLLIIRYRDLFSDRKAYNMALKLYDYGIRYFMFFDNRLDVDEIIYYCLYKEKIVDICSRINHVYSYDSKDIEDNNNCKVIKINCIRKRRK